MLYVLALGLAEKLIHQLICHSPDAQASLHALTGKTLRLDFLSTDHRVDVLFCDAHLRLEPAYEAIFEPQGGIAPPTPDAIIYLDDIGMLLSLLQQPAEWHTITADDKRAHGDANTLQMMEAWLASLSLKTLSSDALNQLHVIIQPLSASTLSTNWQTQAAEWLNTLSDRPLTPHIKKIISQLSQLAAHIYPYQDLQQSQPTPSRYTAANHDYQNNSP